MLEKTIFLFIMLGKNIKFLNLGQGNRKQQTFLADLKVNVLI